jgi:hypothetical protein
MRSAQPRRNPVAQAFMQNILHHASQHGNRDQRQPVIPESFSVRDGAIVWYPA